MTEDRQPRGAPGKTRAGKTTDPSVGSGTARRQTPARLEPALYDGLRAASSVTGQSQNSLLNKAVANYLASDTFHAEMTEAQQRQAETIRKLSGG